MVVYAGQGDVRRSMSLLWRAPDPGHGVRPGPKPGLSVDAIIAAAIVVADAEGMAALSMRAVGERLDRSAMALYTYVPSKNELIDLMYDSVLAELPADHDLGAGWRPALIRWAANLWEFLLRHPWVLQVSQARPVLGPNEYVLLDTAVRILNESGLAAKELWQVLGSVLQLVRGGARTVAEARYAAAATGQPEDEWWYARSAALEAVAPDFAERFPILTRLEQAGAFTFDDETTPYLEQEATETFHTGLAVLLDGVEARTRNVSS